MITWGVFGAAGFQLAVVSVLGLFVGDWLDQKWGSSPWGSILGVTLGAGVGFANLIRLLKYRQNKMEDE